MFVVCEADDDQQPASERTDQKPRAQLIGLNTISFVALNIGSLSDFHPKTMNLVKQ